MNFLYGLYLAGIAAVSLPILFHMIRRTPRGRMPFSTTMFLDPSPPRITRRSRVEHWPLLILRGLALTLIALAFARPFLRQFLQTEQPPEDGTRVLVLVDTSASMQRDGMWEQAVDKVSTLIDNLEDADDVALVTFNSRPQTRLSFEEWNTLEPGARDEVFQARLEQISPEFGNTQLGAALIHAVEELDRQSKESGEATAKSIVLISDVQSGSQLDALKTYEWPKDIDVRLERIQATVPGNATLSLMGDTSGAGTVDVRRLRIYNAADSETEQLEISWLNKNNQPVGEPRSVYVAPGRSKTVRVPAPPGDLAVDRLQISGDSHEFDNTIYVNETGPQEVFVHFWGTDQSNDPESLRFYLERAFPDTRRRRVRIIAANTNGNESTREPLTNEVRLLIATNEIAPDRLKAVKAYLTEGGTLLYVASETGAQESLAELLDAPEIQVTNAKVNDYAMMTDVDFAHPVFAAFADTKYADFTRIHVWNHRSLKIAGLPDMRVLARFDDGDPAIVEQSVGKGRALIFASGWQPKDSQLALSTKFVPLLNSILEIGAPRFDAQSQYFVGDVVPVETFDSDHTDAARFIGPDETETLVAPDETSFTATASPGIYTVASATGAPRFAVNLQPRESRTDPMPDTQLESAGVRLHKKTLAQDIDAAGAAALQRQLRSQELESRQKFWRWLIMGAIAFLLIETWLAGSLANRQAPT